MLGALCLDRRAGTRPTQSDWSRNREPRASWRDARNCFMGLQRSRVDDRRAASSHLTWIRGRLRTVIDNDESVSVYRSSVVHLAVKPAIRTSEGSFTTRGVLNGPSTIDAPSDSACHGTAGLLMIRGRSIV
jgi:hypothetical protein